MLRATWGRKAQKASPAKSSRDEKNDARGVSGLENHACCEEVTSVMACTKGVVVICTSSAYAAGRISAATAFWRVQISARIFPAGRVMRCVWPEVSVRISESWAGV